MSEGSALSESDGSDDEAGKHLFHRMEETPEEGKGVFSYETYRLLERDRFTDTYRLQIQ